MVHIENVLNFDIAFNKLIGMEGGYVNDPSDSGGETKYGITVNVAVQNGYYGDMKDLTLEFAKSIYKKKYWDIHRLDEFPYEIAFEIFEIGVNCGTKLSALFLQKALNLLNNEEKYYKDILEDRVIGNKTINAFKAYFGVRGNDGVVVLTTMLNVMQGNHYIELCIRRRKDEKFIYGWFKDRVVGGHKNE